MMAPQNKKTCFRCGQADHFVANCPERVQDSFNEDFQIMMLEEMTRDKKRLRASKQNIIAQPGSNTRSSNQAAIFGEGLTSQKHLQAPKDAQRLRRELISNGWTGSAYRSHQRTRSRWKSRYGFVNYWTRYKALLMAWLTCFIFARR